MTFAPTTVDILDQLNSVEVELRYRASIVPTMRQRRDLWSRAEGVRLAIRLIEAFES